MRVVIVQKVPSDKTSSTEMKLEDFKKTELFADISNILKDDQSSADFYDAKAFSKLDKKEIPAVEKILAGILLEKEGHKPILMTRSGEAVQLEKKAIRIHQEAADGAEVVRTFDKR